MELRCCTSKADYKTYKGFIKALYKGDGQYRDYITPILTEIFEEKSTFSRNLTKEAFCIYEREELVGVVSFLIPHGAPDAVQVAFLEYKAGYDVAAFVLKAARAWAHEKGISQIIVGLNGHVNYGLGLSVALEHPAGFGESYTKPYYVSDLSLLGGTETSLSSYTYNWNRALFPADEKWIQRVSKDFTFRTMTLKTYKQDIALYTKLNNESFTQHPFYFSRSKAEDLELFNELRFFLTKGSLIFAEYKGEAVGFMLWYPDWSSLMKPGETLSVWTFVKTLLHRRKVDTFKMVEWGILPQFHGKGIPIGLLYHCYQHVKDGGYKYCKTGWILDENKNSNVFTRKWGEVYATYKVYEFQGFSAEGQVESAC